MALDPATPLPACSPRQVAYQAQECSSATNPNVCLRETWHVLVGVEGKYLRAGFENKTWELRGEPSRNERYRLNELLSL